MNSSKSRLRSTILLKERILQSASTSSLGLAFGELLQIHRLLKKVLYKTSLKTQSVLIIYKIVLKDHFLLIHREIPDMSWVLCLCEYNTGHFSLAFSFDFFLNAAKVCTDGKTESQGAAITIKPSHNPCLISTLGRINTFPLATCRWWYIMSLCVDDGECIKIIIISTIYRWNVRNIFYFENSCHKW